MTDNVELVLGLVTLMVAIVASILHIRRPPKGDWRALFQRTLQAEGVEKKVRPIHAQWLVVGCGDDADTVYAQLTEQMNNSVLRYAGADVVALRARLEECCGKRSQKLVVVATGEGLPALVSALVELPHVRDGLLAVVSLGGAVDQLDPESFTHEKLDVEQGLPVPYFSISLDNEKSGLFPVPSDQAGLEQSILAIDLGDVGPTQAHNMAAIANALRTTVETVIWAGRS